MRALRYALALLLVSAVVTPAAFAQPKAGTAKPGILTVGFIPAEDARAMVRQSQAIMDIVAQQTGLKVESFVGSDYNATIEALRNGHVDVALLGPFSYVLATTQAPVEAFAVTVIAKTMQPSYRSIIIARNESPISALAEIKGRTFAFVDPGSTSGYMVPAAAFITSGITPEKDFAKVMYSGGHDATIVAVAEGKVEGERSPTAFTSAGAPRGWPTATSSRSSGNRTPFPMIRCSTGRICRKTSRRRSGR